MKNCKTCQGKGWVDDPSDGGTVCCPTCDGDTNMTQDEIEAFFLNHDDPIYEQIQEAETEDEAEGIASDALNDEGLEYESRDLITVVRKIREQE